MATDAGPTAGAALATAAPRPAWRGLRSVVLTFLTRPQVDRGLLRRAFDALPGARLITASDGRIVFANAAFHRRFGRPDAPIADLLERAAADCEAPALGELRAAAAAATPATIATGLARPDTAAACPVTVSVGPIPGYSGYSLWRIEDSLDREREAAVARSPRRWFDRFFAEAPIGVALIDRSGRFVEANRAAAALFGHGRERLIGRDLAGLFGTSDRAAVTAMLTRDAAAASAPVEVRLDGANERTLVLFLGRLDGGGDEAVSALHVIDVSERKNLELQFAQSQKMQAIGQLAGGIAHDFNNLLTAMIGFCDLLLLRCRPGDPSFADIMQIQQNAKRAANLVRQLLAFSRQQALQPRVLDVTDILVELSHLLRRLIGENIELDLEHGRDLGLTRVDQGQFEQVIINLAVNARDAMPGGGRLTIRTQGAVHKEALRRGHELMPAGEYVLIEVADTGIGIPATDLERIFEPFFSTKEGGAGAGLGLSTVYGIVRQTGGFIFADSVPGRGSRFRIYLPRCPAPDPATLRAETAEPAVVRDLTGAGVIMLVEDDDPVRTFGARALRNKGYTVVEANSGEAALDKIRDAEIQIDLLVTDVVMPRMDGPSLVRAVREIQPAIKVIFISGYAEDAFRQRLDSGIDIHFLAKPFSLRQLAIKVKEVSKPRGRSAEIQVRPAATVSARARPR